MEEEPTGVVYGLYDPATDDLRYIGATVRPLRQRLFKHMSSSRNPHYTVHKWIASLDERPTIRALSEELPLRRLYGEEVRQIEAAKLDGASLLNSTKGGDGSRGNGGWNHTEAAREVIAEASRDTKNHQPDCECWKCVVRKGPAHPRYGKKHSPESRARISAATKGIAKPRSPEHQRALWDARRANGTGTHTDATKAKISATKAAQSTVIYKCAKCGRECKGQSGLRIHHKKAHAGVAA